MTIKPTHRQINPSARALIVVEVQRDFCEGGSLAVAGGAAIAGAIRAWIDARRDRYRLVAASLDWHAAPPADNGGHFALSGPPDHCCLATARDAVGLGFDVTVLTDLQAGVAPASTAAAWAELAALGTLVTTTGTLA